MTTSKANLARMFRQIVGDTYVIDDAETQKPYECDGFSAYCEMPLLVVLPATSDEVREIMEICHRYRIPVVARGAGTGLSAGAMPNSDGVLLSSARLNKILKIDPDARTAVVQAGVRNLSVSEGAAEHGLFYAPDPSSQIACTIGGNVAENSGGVHCLKYGLTVHNILKLKVVTATGEELVVGSDGLDQVGPDMLSLLVGSEGMLGFVTEITLKLLPRPEVVQILMAAFDDVLKAGEAVGRIISSGIVPSGLEMMDKLATRAAEDFVAAGYPTDAAALLLCELDGSEQEVDDHAAKVEQLLWESEATLVRVSQNDAERLLLWKGRKAAFPAVGRISPDYYCMDGTVPRGEIAVVLAEIAALSEYYGLRVANVFHAGDGNLHPLILFDANVPGEFAKTEEFGAKILELCVRVGGSITGEHGVGVEKLGQMPAQFNDQEIAQFHAVKHAFDAETLLNPGKGIPQLKRCQEYRAIETAQSLVS